LTTPPLPARPCLRVKLDYLNADTSRAGSRFYLSYAGGAPTPANCVTLATDIATAWGTDLAQLVASQWSLAEVDVLDIATNSGSSGIHAASIAGTNSGTAMPAQTALNVEFQIARRYRGGKPRMFLPPPAIEETVDAGHFSSSFVGTANTQVAAFFTAVEALSVGAVGALQHINLSYYHSFTNIANSSGRERAVPKYKDAATLDTVTGYAAKALIGSQRRRRVSTTY